MYIRIQSTDSYMKRKVCLYVFHCLFVCLLKIILQGQITILILRTDFHQFNSEDETGVWSAKFLFFRCSYLQ